MAGLVGCGMVCFPKWRGPLKFEEKRILSRRMAQRSSPQGQASSEQASAGTRTGRSPKTRQNWSQSDCRGVEFARAQATKSPYASHPSRLALSTSLSTSCSIPLISLQPLHQFLLAFLLAAFCCCSELQSGCIRLHAILCTVPPLTLSHHSE